LQITNCGEQRFWWLLPERIAAVADWARFDFKGRKFKEMVLYFSKRGQDEGLVIGSTKLNKLLFFSDFRAYWKLGQPISGARYQKLERGPAARQFVPMQDRMLADGEVRWKPKQENEWDDVLLPVSTPNTDLFATDELAVMDEVFEELRPFNATATSDYSHLRSAGWQVVELHDDIPYESAFASTEPAPQEAIDLGRQLAERYGW
jgi:hypothetical protein